ncbi:MAG: nitrate reductase molybdenum cofactor assembly chaperone [Rhodospirillales bacterium]|nr:nitrate reductase molybdenum cofactor assembly chaperone [Rhodospirillales bacterium]
MNEAGEVLREAYGCIAELWCSPRDVDRAALEKRTTGAVAQLQAADAEAAALLSRFLGNPVSEEEYVELFELDPRCPLYVGSHVFEEPKTCAKAGLSERNGYMIELLGVYRHMGLSPDRSEMPDYLPLMVEFLFLSAGSQDPVREKLIKEYMLPYLPRIRSKLDQLNTPYAGLLEALERVLRIDIAQAREVSHV